MSNQYKLPANTISSFNSMELRAVLGDFATGVTVISCSGDGRPLAITANAFTSVSLEPPLVLVSIGENSRLLNHLDLGSSFAISILSGEQEQIARCYGSSKNIPDDAHWSVVDTLPVIAEAAAHLGCEVSALHRHGDHVLVIAAVTWIARSETLPVLTFHRGRFGNCH